MAHIQKRKGSKGTIYQTRYRDPTGKERARNFPRKLDAEKFLHSVEADKLRGAWADPRRGSLRFSDWAEETEASRVHLRPATLIRDEASLRNHILPRFGDTPLARIDPASVRRWVADLEVKGLAPATVHKTYQIFARIMQAAATDRLVTSSPCIGVRLPRFLAAQARFLSPDEIHSVAEAVIPRYRPMVLAAGYTGLRFGELCALRVEHFDELRRRIRVEESLSEIGGRFHFGPPKSSASRRTISLPPFLVDTLASHLVEFLDASGLLFGSPGGGPIRRSNFRRRHWLPAVRETVGEPCPFHSLRHSHAAMLIKEGVHPKVVQERLGHASIKTTLDIYGHLLPGLDEAAAEVLDAAYQARRADSVRTGEAVAHLTMNQE